MAPRGRRRASVPISCSHFSQPWYPDLRGQQCGWSTRPGLEVSNEARPVSCMCGEAAGDARRTGAGDAAGAVCPR